jgi:hypothetical protein
MVFYDGFNLVSTMEYWKESIASFKQQREKLEGIVVWRTSLP